MGHPRQQQPPDSVGTGASGTGSLGSAMSHTVSSWSLGGGGGVPGPRIGVIGTEAMASGGAGIQDDGLREDRKPLPKLNPMKPDKGSCTSVRTPREVDLWSAAFDFYLEFECIDLLRRVPNWCSIVLRALAHVGRL